MFWNLFKKKKIEISDKKIESHGIVHSVEKKPRCRVCDKTYTEDYTAGLCASCWKKDYDLKKEFYFPYKKRLDTALDEIGIITSDLSQKGIREYGIPEFEVIEHDWMEGIHLRKNERALYTVPCRNCTFGFPSNGIGLRYLYVSTNRQDQEWAKKVDFSDRILAITSDNEELYWLTEKGVIKSTKPYWNEFYLFYNVDECRKICAIIPCESVKLHISKLESGSKYGEYRIFNIQHHTFYDANAKVVFTVFADGNYYHGYDVSYFVHSKKEVLERILAYGHRSLYDISRECSIGQIPAFAVADMLEIDESNRSYEPPTDVGYGSIYM